MCGIWALITYKQEGQDALADIEKYVTQLDSRGPEMMRIKQYELVGQGCRSDRRDVVVTLGFTRLAINGLHEGGMQPFEWTAPDGSRYAWICNGEIYNWRALAEEFGLEG